jgi:GGDEF domain-containing protein
MDDTARQKEVDRLNETIRTLMKKNGDLEQVIGDLEEKLFRCPITGLYNETFFRRYVQGAVDVSLDVHADGALLFISIDRFSDVNIRHGSEGANETLRKFAAALPNSVPPDAVLFRLGERCSPATSPGPTGDWPPPWRNGSDPTPRKRTSMSNR